MARQLLLRWALMLGALGWTAVQLPPLIRSAGAEAGLLGRLSWGWVAAAAVLGLVAVALYAELHRQLLVVGGARPPAAAVQSITFAQNAIGNTVPVVGGAGAMAYAVGRLRRRGIDTGLATWSVLVAGVLSFFCLLVLGAGALAAAGVLPLAGGALACVGAVVVAVATWVLVTRQTLWRRLTGLVGRGGRAADVLIRVRCFVSRLSRLRPSPRQWLQLLAVAALTWLLDFADLVVASAAVPGSVPWPALVQGFLVVQASIALQILPGGAGLAEVGLLGVLLGSGVAAGPAAAVVLIYRTTSWLLPSVLGWVVYGGQLHRSGATPSELPVAEAGNVRPLVRPCEPDETAEPALPMSA